jgi:hypothetical protein
MARLEGLVRDCIEKLKGLHSAVFAAAYDDNIGAAFLKGPAEALCDDLT